MAFARIDRVWGWASARNHRGRTTGLPLSSRPSERPPFLSSRPSERPPFLSSRARERQRPRRGISSTSRHPDPSGIGTTPLPDVIPSAAAVRPRSRGISPTQRRLPLSSRPSERSERVEGSPRLNAVPPTNSLRGEPSRRPCPGWLIDEIPPARDRPFAAVELNHEPARENDPSAGRVPWRPS